MSDVEEKTTPTSNVQSTVKKYSRGIPIVDGFFKQETQIKVIGKRVIVKRQKKDVGGLKLTPELEREGHPDIGVITAVGKIGWWNRYVRGIQPGRTIYYTRYSPIKVKDDERLMFVDVENILGIKVGVQNKTID